MSPKNFRRPRNPSKGSKSSSGSRSGRRSATEAASRLPCPHEDCGRTYANQATLDRHIAQHHIEPELEPEPWPQESMVDALERRLITFNLSADEADAVAALRVLADIIDTGEHRDRIKALDAYRVEIDALAHRSGPEPEPDADDEDDVT